MVYRHPKFANVEEFLLKLDESLSNIPSDNKLCYILGNFNINIYDTVNNPGKKKMLNLVRSNGFHSLVSKATRISHSSATSIDHILSSESHFKVYLAILQCSISDHYAVLCAISKLAPNSSKTIFHNYFNLKQFDPEKFCEELQTF